MWRGGGGGGGSEEEGGGRGSCLRWVVVRRIDGVLLGGTFVSRQFNQ